MSYLNLPAPVLNGLELVPDASSNSRPFYRPWSFSILLPGDVPGGGFQYFWGEEYFQQFTEGKTLDFSTSGGGDTYTLCGTDAFQVSDENIVSVMGGGSFRRRQRRKYSPMMSDPPEGEEAVFTGGFQMELIVEIYDDELTAIGLQSRVHEVDKAIIYENLLNEPSGALPNFSEVGTWRLLEPVDLGVLHLVGIEWQNKLATAPDGAWATGVAECYHRTQTDSGKNAMIAFGMARVLEADVEWPVFGEDDVPEYELDGIQPLLLFEARANKPVVYEETGHPIVGNSIYGVGEAKTELRDLITVKKWKDAYGIYDQGQAALDEVPWVETVWYAEYHRDGFGQVSRGRFIVLSGSYRITLKKVGGGTALELEVSAGEPVEYSFGLVATPEEEAAVELEKIERSNGEGGWVALPAESYLEIMGSAPDPGVLIIHSRRYRTGVRWGHWEFVEPTDPPATPADERRYKLKVHTKEASP